MFSRGAFEVEALPTENVDKAIRMIFDDPDIVRNFAFLNNSFSCNLFPVEQNFCSLKQAKTLNNPEYIGINLVSKKNASNSKS